MLTQALSPLDRYLLPPAQRLVFSVLGWYGGTAQGSSWSLSHRQRGSRAGTSARQTLSLPEKVGTLFQLFNTEIPSLRCKLAPQTLNPGFWGQKQAGRRRQGSLHCLDDCAQLPGQTAPSEYSRSLPAVSLQRPEHKVSF